MDDEIRDIIERSWPWLLESFRHPSNELQNKIRR